MAMMKTDVKADPVQIAPSTYKVLLEDDRARVLDIRLPGRGHSPLHSHPGYIAYALSDARVRFTRPDGSTQEVSMKAGDCISCPAETHEVDNLLDSECHVLNIELK